MLNMLDIMFVRHPETEGNADHKLIGSENIILSQKGVEQIEPLLDHIRHNISYKNNVVNVFSNNLLRCKIIARPLRDTLSYFNFKQGEYIVDKDLMERNFGILHGKTKQEALEMFPDYTNFDALLKTKSMGFESTDSLRKRTQRALNSIIANHQNENNIIISSSSSGRSLISILLNHGEEEFDKIHGKGPRNCEIWKRTSENPGQIIRNALLT